MFVFQEIIMPNDCINNKEFLYVFGDNLLEKGEKGQAIIRKVSSKNVFGVPTKRLPSMKEGSFFSDQLEEQEIVLKKLTELWNCHKEGRVIVLPNNPFGSNLAQLEKRSPKINELILRFYRSAKEEKTS